MSNFELEKLITENKEYHNSFKNNVWFNNSIMMLLANDKDIDIKMVLEVVHRLCANCFRR